MMNDALSYLIAVAVVGGGIVISRAVYVLDWLIHDLRHRQEIPECRRCRMSRMGKA